MGLQSSRHRQVLDELTEWWEDISQGDVCSRVVLVEVPSAWGASTILKKFEKTIDGPGTPVTISVSIDSTSLVSRAIEAQGLCDALMTPFVRSRLAELIELDTTKGRIQLGIGVGSLFASGLAVAAPLLLASLAVTAAGNAWDTSPAGQQGAVARVARSVAAVSVTAPVAVIIDDADRLNPGLAVTMIENLVSRYDGHVFVVAKTAPNSQLREDLNSHTRYGLLGRVRMAEVDLDMSAEARAALVHELCPRLPDVVIQRIARRTDSFKEVFAISAAEKMADLSAETELSALEDIDAIINATVIREEVSAEAKIVAWAGGTMINRQVDKALEILSADRREADPWVIPRNGITRLLDQASARVREQVDVLASGTKRALASAVMEGAVSVAGDPDATLIERTVARLAVHRVRADLPASSELTSMQCALIRGLETLGDPAAAHEVAAVALAELPAEGQQGQRRAELLKAWLRLARIRRPTEDDPFIREAINLAVTNGALLGLEAQVWAAVDLLHRSHQRGTALKLTDHIITELARFHSWDAAANQWRLLLAFHLGKAGYSDAAHRVLTPIINSGTTQQQEAAQAVLRAVDGSRADTRLQIIILEAELATAQAGMEHEIFQLLRTLADDYSDLGNYPKALEYGSEAFNLSSRINGMDHPLTLVICGDIAYWTGQSGDYAACLRLFQELLPEQARVMGPDHPNVLGTRGDIAYWTGRGGDYSRALQLSQELLPDEVRVLGSDHPMVLRLRNSIGRWMGSCGNFAGALQLCQEMLPDQIRILGRDNRDVLTTRGNIARWTGWCGNHAQALLLFKQLLPDEIRVMGPDHPNVLLIRSDIARWTGQCGDSSGALSLYEELLPDEVRVLGSDHPSVLTTRGNIATWTGQCGDYPRALQLFRQLLPDQIRVLGPDHPNVLTARNNLANWTGHCGDYERALHLYMELLPDQVRVLGSEHPDVLSTLNNILAWTLQREIGAGAAPSPQVRPARGPDSPHKSTGS